MSNEVDKNLVRKCILCGREYLKPQTICPKCNVVLLELSDYELLEMEKRRTNIPKCPTCGSTNIKRISALNRAVSIGMLGVFSGKIGKNYECLNCKAKW